jgi:tripartite-type tricarboxylate transporter receptor subunit TctC
VQTVIPQTTDIGFDPFDMAYYESGDLRPVLIESPNWKLLEDAGVPKSQDLYGYNIVNPAAILAPPDTPENIRATLEAAVKEALADPAVFEQMLNTNEFVRFMMGVEAKVYAQDGFKMYAPSSKNWVWRKPSSPER